MARKSLKRPKHDPVEHEELEEEHEEEMHRHALRAFKVGAGLPNLTALSEELIDMTNVLLGRQLPPTKLLGSSLALMEVADAYFARASEIKMMIQRFEREDRVLRGSPHYKFSRGELQTFMDMARKASELGSRRLTQDQMKAEAARTGRDSISD